MLMPFASSAFAADEPNRELLLEVWVNGHSNHAIVHVSERAGVLWIDRAALADAGIITFPGEGGPDGLVSLTELQGVEIKIDEVEQKLFLTSASGRTAPQVYDFRPLDGIENQATAGTGFALQYDGVVNTGDRRDPVTAGADLSATMFTPRGIVTATGFATTGRAGDQFVRLDSAIEVDQPDALRVWSAGDAISGGLDWSRPVRFAGLHIATDFSLQPELATLPLPQFFGSTTVPATVDVFVNAARVAETQVDPGPFEIRNLPVVTGSGEATFVTRDVLGRETSQTMQFYATNRLLAKGLFDYSLDIGALRQSYGQQSFDYGNAMAQATMRYGWTNWLTVEAHGEASSDLALLGGGANFTIAPFGVLGAAIAASSGRRGDGGLISLSAQSDPHPFGLFASLVATTENYSDVGTMDGPPPARLRLQVGGNLALGARGSLAVSWISLDDGGGKATRLATASYALPLGGGLYFGVSGLYDRGTNTWSVQSFLSVPLGGKDVAAASVSDDRGGYQAQLSVSRPANPDGGFGYRVSAATGENDIAEADATWVGEHVRLDGGVSSINGQVAAQASASGAIVAMDGAVFATRQTDDAFAIVRTGQPDVRIYRENRQVAISDADGEALVPGLNAYDRNLIGIDPRDYPMNVSVEQNERVVVPRRQSGVVVDLAPAIGRPVLLTIRLAAGDYPPAGARAWLDGNPRPLVVGRHGQLFLPDLRANSSGKIELAVGVCRFQVEPPSGTPKDVIPALGPVICIMEPPDGH